MAEPNARLIQTLIEARQRHCFPPDVRASAPEFIEKVLALLFPHFSQRLDCSAVGVRSEVATVEAVLTRVLDTLAPRYPASRDIPQRFMDALPEIYGWLRQDADAIFEADPAARSVDEVILTYPGFYAIAIYRLAHALHEFGFPLLPRLLTELAHQRTGVDIHPGATIGRRFVIDHGTGVVIGETTVIGDRVNIYQGVTLGALQVQKNLADKKRHPTIEDDVVIYANATILGGDTVVGRGSVIAGNAFITQSIPPESMVTRRSEVRARQGKTEFDELEYHI
ncbi:serine O-acetyltransferase EpsC [Cystobacter ferrugineus]|uniref:Serine acetyltransferase n=1 Tax=Cystobacter ferrugineus TaxID=83449 RepID=A0A1L9BER3_9BACT|nr:serine O-acetyltransferase EpsC [Cystobacter ferrugineus]OJH40739.1 serine acetyltransferase [Cystobacter ferrugineus]